jgi:hypothetical protein
MAAGNARNAVAPASLPAVPIIAVVAALPEHTAPVAAALRAADVAEVWATARLSPEDAVRRSLAASPLAWAGLVDERPVCLFGAGCWSLLGEVGVPWLLGTAEIERHAAAFLRRNRAYVARMRQTFPVLRNHVDARNRVSIRWLRWLGFTIAPAQPYGPFGLPFHPFEMR